MKCSLSLIEIENSVLLCDRVTIDNRFVRTNWGRNILVALLFFNFQSISEIRQVANIAICSRLIPRLVTLCNFLLFKTILVAKSHLCFDKYQQQYKIYFQDLLIFLKFYDMIWYYMVSTSVRNFFVDLKKDLDLDALDKRNWQISGNETPGF